MPTGRRSRRADCQRNFWLEGNIINKAARRIPQDKQKQVQIITTHPEAAIAALRQYGDVFLDVIRQHGKSDQQSDLRPGLR
jgi:hypothetical protein